MISHISVNFTDMGKAIFLLTGFRNLSCSMSANKFKVRLTKLGINHLDVIGITLVLGAEGNMLRMHLLVQRCKKYVSQH